MSFIHYQTAGPIATTFGTNMYKTNRQKIGQVKN